LDTHYRQEETDESFRSLAVAALSKVRRELERATRLRKKLGEDLVRHGDPDEWKRKGDLLLANSANARRVDDHFVVIDYFNESLPEVEIKAEPNESVTETAERCFRRYTKARNAASEIKKRLAEIEKEILGLESSLRSVEEAVEQGDRAYLEQVTGAEKQKGLKRQKKSKVDSPSVTRTFISSDGFEILVGKRAKDNDYLTFRLARSLDTWMHAADYPGSHVVVRNPARREIPTKTLLEAAKIAAFYSKGNKQPKAAVHYTQKKFVNKPRGAAPGLVSLSSFKTLLVEPGIPDGIKIEQ
jgi:predicted ribosome quality control (RQC) complex YloA/Tae2 family protein